MQNRKTHLRLVLLVCIIWAGLNAVYPPALVYAELPPRPTRPPSRERPNPVPPAGTLILHTQPTVTGLWSVVQWQDVTGKWQDVEGWRGEINAGKTIWWVEQAQWNKGLFRWAIFEAKDGKLLATSVIFSLPGSGETSVIPVHLQKFWMTKEYK